MGIEKYPPIFLMSHSIRKNCEMVEVVEFSVSIFIHSALKIGAITGAPDLGGPGGPRTP